MTDLILTSDPVSKYRAKINGLLGDDVATRPVLDVGVPGQTRAGRILTLADFTSLLGLSAPVGLYSFTGGAPFYDDASGGSRTLLTKNGNAISAPGILGGVAGGVRFVGSGGALYRADGGPTDKFRIATGSWGGWFSTAKRGTAQMLISKAGSLSAGWYARITTGNVLEAAVNISGTAGGSVTVQAGATDVCDERWHHVAVTFDGLAVRLYLDGVLEASRTAAGTIYPATGPFNVGAYGADASTPAQSPHFGSIDEAFVTADVLAPDQVRLLYAASVPHSLAAVPADARVRVRRRRRGPYLVSGDFPAQPLRLYNLGTDGVADSGSNNQPLTINAQADPANVAGPDGVTAGAAFLDGVDDYFTATDAGLPSGTGVRSYGMWFATSDVLTDALLSWGNGNRLQLTSDGRISAEAGAFSAPNQSIDGVWHHVVVVADPAAADGLQGKLYLDGKLVASATAAPPSITLAGAAGFHIGTGPSGVAPINAAIARVFVCGYALTAQQVAALYGKGSSPLPPSPKNPGEHIEAMDASKLYVICDSLEPQHQVDLRVVA